MSFVEGYYKPPRVGDNQSEGEVPPIVALAEQGSPEVIELVNILYDTYTLQQSLQAAAEQPQEMNTLPVHVDPSFTERYRRASLFVEAAVHIMRGSFIAYPEDPAYIRHVLDAAVAPYGYHVAKGKEPGMAYSQLEEQSMRYLKSRRGKFLPRNKLEFYFGD